MFDNTNPYTLRRSVVGGITHYYVAFTDGQAVLRETEVSRPVYLEFLRFIKVERNLRRSDERHIEQSELTDETLYNRAAHPPKSVEDAAFDNQVDRLKLQEDQLMQYFPPGTTPRQMEEVIFRLLEHWKHQRNTDK